ncbi:MAG TPA: ABC transporter permease subunit [Candidatus Limiplasma sp.]|nr:ABC transporter permease subunit [Candidatus Limiplasma sp.]
MPMLGTTARHTKLGQKKDDKSLWQKIVRDKWLLLIFAPGMLNVLIFKYLPMAGLVMAFQEYKPLRGILGSRWVGLMQFSRLFTSVDFGRVLWNSISLNLQGLVFSFPMSIIFALLLNEMRGRKFKRLTQTVAYLPYFISSVIVAGMVKMFCTPPIGFISRIIGTLTGGSSPMLLAMPQASHAILITTGIWQGFGWGSIIYLSALAGVDPQLYEAATIDGASRFQRVMNITLPSLYPVISIQLIMTVGGLMNSSFDLPWMLQNGLNMRTMETIATWNYKLSIGSHLGLYSYSTAVGLFQSVINLVLIIIANTVSRRISETSFF